MDNFFSSLRLFDDLDRRKINSCRTVQPNIKDIPHDFEPKQLKFKRGDIRMKTRGGLTALALKDRREVYMLINMDPSSAERNFCEYSNRSLKPHIMEWYNRHKGYVDNSDHMANRYSKSWHAFKWTTKLFFHLLDLNILNSWILLSSCGAKYTHWDFRLLLVRNLIEEAVNTQDHTTPDWLEDQVRPQQMLCDSRATITNTASEINKSTLLLSVFFSRPEKGLSV